MIKIILALIKIPSRTNMCSINHVIEDLSQEIHQIAVVDHNETS